MMLPICPETENGQHEPGTLYPALDLTSNKRWPCDVRIECKCQQCGAIGIVTGWRIYGSTLSTDPRGIRWTDAPAPEINHASWLAVTDASPRQRGRYMIWTPHGWPDFAWWEPGARYCGDGRWANALGMAAFPYEYGVTHWREEPDGPSIR